MPDTLKDRDDASIIEAVPTGRVDTEDASESYYCNADIYNNSLARDDYSTVKLSVNLVCFDSGRVSVENIVHEKRLAEALQSDSTVTFIDLGSGYENDPLQATLAAIQIILAKYSVSPLFLQDGPIPHLSGIGCGVGSNIVFSDTIPNEVCGYHVWYSLPLRTSLRSTAFPTVSTDDTPTADERKTATILYSPHGTDCAATLRTFLCHPNPLDIEVDPFSVHLLYLSRAVIDWRNVFQDITNELTHYEREITAVTQSSGLKTTRQLHSLAIVVARMGSEIRITVDILYGLQRAHNEFYDMVLKTHDRFSRPPIYHRLQSDFLNLVKTFSSCLIEVIELESRIRNCIILVRLSALPASSQH
ncbi:hypothetical protein PILCRDRAFT_10153 [Piloderma croceum F 1598]|uniref:Uncharacterized protein n=1 Tax=Piloderma croceum (strain F 1598) TaxID=765440 RepID=A0A0C3BQU5_PILCF|nr:hypothetical protein PILCRDRAFT_10153 [Piloderma croceum F 1598]